MTSYLILDTESSGLFTFKGADGKPVPADAPGQPRLASVSMLMVGPDMKLEREYHQLVKPDGWVMTEGATAVNGLTDAILNERGDPVRRALEQWIKAIAEEKRVVVAHNAQHDCKQMRAELRRAGLPDLFEQTKNVCTMRSLMGIVKKADGKGGWPKLDDVLRHFNLPVNEERHTARGDVYALYGVVKCMTQKGLLREGAIHYAKVGYEKNKAKGRQSLRAGLAASVAGAANDDDDGPSLFRPNLAAPSEEDF